MEDQVVLRRIFVVCFACENDNGPNFEQHDSVDNAADMLLNVQCSMRQSTQRWRPIIISPLAYK